MYKILIVDDENITRDVLINNLPWSWLGISEVKGADDGIKALQIAADYKPDIILSDIRMPKMNGIELAENVQLILPECRFVFLSGFSDKEYLKSAIRLKAISYVEKPIDLEEITQALRTAVSECKHVRENSLNNALLIRQKLCLSLTHRHHNSHDAERVILQPEFELPKNSKYISSVIWLCPINTGTDGDLPKLQKKLEEIFINFSLPLKDRILWSFKDNDYFIVHFKTDEQYDKCYFVEFMSRLQLQTETSCSMNGRLFIGIGNEVQGLYEIYISFQCALIAQKRCFFSGRKGIKVFMEDSSKPYMFDESTLTFFSTSLRSEKRDEVDLFVKRLSNDIVKYENTQIDYIKSIFTKILLVIIRFTEDRNITSVKNEYSYFLNSINSAPTLEDIVNGIIALIDRIFREITSTNINTDTITKITSYILQNFNDEELSVNSIAKNLFLTPNYLCLVFKRETGKTINQYITEIRVEKAKTYLKDSGVKLTSIAKSVGYNDAKYFSKVFEKCIGIKPKEYREMHCREHKSD